MEKREPGSRFSRFHSMLRAELPRFLERLLALPTAPFHERFVAAFLRRELTAAGLDFTVDAYGNIIARAAGPAGAPSLAMVAHMDHPGFEIVDAANEKAEAHAKAKAHANAEAQWFGGVAAKYFIGARVVVYDQDSGAVVARGAVRRIVKNPQGRVEKMTLQLEGRARPGDFGTWDLTPFRRQGGLVHTKGADDLVGCAAIVAALKRLKQRGAGGGVCGVFTRAEEQGFIGTLGMIRAGRLPRSTKIISVETSKALPGVVLGGGPVIRLGDRAAMFDDKMVAFMDMAARDLQKKDHRFRFQRRVMDGGTCEATPYLLNGYSAGGIAIPLHNYHNQGRTKIGAEAVAIRDVDGAVVFLTELAARIKDFDRAAADLKQRIEGGLEKYGARLKAASREFS